MADVLTADRRHIHMHPELGFEERETSAFIQRRLSDAGVTFEAGIAGTGVLATIAGSGGAGKTVLLRADIDALPIDEQADVPYRSQNPGVMHACGHDAHTAILLGTARVLAADRLRFAGTVKLAFQPCEERFPGGAIKMIEAGVMDNPTVDAAFGLHCTPQLEAGSFGFRVGPASAASDRFTISVIGRGGHAARPNSCVDAVVVAAHLVVLLQTIISRETPPIQPAVLTVGAIHAGDAHNVIPGEATIRGTVRTYDTGLREQIADRLRELVTGAARAMRAEAKVDYVFGYPSLVNDGPMTDLARSVALDLVGAEAVFVAEQALGGEDMAYFLRRAPGCFFRLGTGNRARGITYGNHHPRFDVEEAALPFGVAAMAGVALRFLGS
ncbi:MAG: amidohydrolase [Chloroflexota bacterium]|nr:MAG: amidohydrolase [Chloroflexota bacterium]